MITFPSGAHLTDADVFKAFGVLITAPSDAMLKSSLFLDGRAFAAFRQDDNVVILRNLAASLDAFLAEVKAFCEQRLESAR